MSFVSDRSAVTAVEYGMIAAITVLAIVAGATSLGHSTSGIFQHVQTNI
ncbi:MAG: hypothetical protein B7Z75_09235 [Acidocella sp. 20-57-95]|nr:MAG: hypothetical protein B7Z75_09235 [Acidocella sp. 20-57-95]OYV60993.1 MAG: hypothetical protein B7Z71_05320 [Acidocella sp. 21-58-7]HQT64161.1 Flp family type IVb pilin [Acidocella sp.]